MPFLRHFNGQFRSKRSIGQHFCGTETTYSMLYFGFLCAERKTFQTQGEEESTKYECNRTKKEVARGLFIVPKRVLIDLGPHGTQNLPKSSKTIKNRQKWCFLTPPKGSPRPPKRGPKVTKIVKNAKKGQKSGLYGSKGSKKTPSGWSNLGYPQEWPPKRVFCLQNP